jgi:hypothetical protein
METMLGPGEFGSIESIPTRLMKMNIAEQFTFHVLAYTAKSQPA